MFEQTFKNIDDVLWKEAGCATELDYTEQTSWILFLKYLDDLERANEQKAELQGKKYESIIDKPHRWSVWAAPKKKDGSFDHDKALTGDDLIEYVDEKLFPYLKGFRTRAEGAEHHRIQDRRNLRRDRKQVPQRLFAARRAGTGRSASASARSRRSTSCRNSTKPSSATWAMPGGTAANTTRRARSSAP